MTHYPLVVSAKGRSFPTYAVGLMAFIINPQLQFLFLKQPQRRGWEVVNGGLEADETLLEGMYREIKEEAGPDIQVKPITTLHAMNFKYDDTIPKMISITYLFEYTGGQVIPGDDMRGSEVTWASYDDIASGSIELIAPYKKDWLFEHATFLYQSMRPLEISQFIEDPSQARSKYESK
ncbi:hypothetical protein MASR2M15_08030 [Anaerolineales bacterium]